MMLPLLSALPDRIRADTTVKFTRAYADFPANQGWTLTLYLRGASALEKAATPNGANFDIVLSAAATLALAPGNYVWTEVAEKSGEKYEAGSGTVVVDPDLNSYGAGATGLQSFEERMIPILEAAVEKRLTSDMEHYQIDGQAVSKIPIEKLHDLLASYRAKVRQKQMGRGKMGNVHVKFSETAAE